ncbi:MAG: DNA polymerase III subunit delta [Intestinibacter sp.]
MKYKDIVYNIKDKNFEKIYLLYGKEHYLIDNAIKLFRESLNESMIDFNLETIDGKETTLDQLLSSIETLPFMDERKIVIVKDFELFTKSRKEFQTKMKRHLQVIWKIFRQLF